MTPDPIATLLAERGTIVLDGGLATELERRGKDLHDALWSARVLVEDPDAIRRVHASYFAAGADVAISSSYQATFEGFAGRGLSKDEAASLMRTSVALARDAAPDGALVAASVGPYGAMLGNGAEYTGDYDRGEDELVEFHAPRMEALAAAGPDLFAVETIPSIVEARALVRALGSFPEVPAWVSFSCRDGAHICDGTPYEEAIAVATSAPSVVAVGVNCTSPMHIEALVEIAATATERPVVCYPNRGSFWDPVRKTWTDPPRQDARPLLRPLEWRRAGARLIGGCCGTTPEDIASIAAALTAAA
ncbi:MAG TPA: homocysteine S-methyltransferase [Actinomycetota bacterium]|nr:homocysteine S-methyltransferase [Actinomycetota bacterium]